MSETPKFEVIDRRRMKAEEEEKEHHPAQASEVTPEPKPAPEPASTPEPARPVSGPRLVTKEEQKESAAAEPGNGAAQPGMPVAPTAEESQEQKNAYDASAQRLEDLIRAQNPAAGAPPQMKFEHLVQQLYVTAMIQMGAGTAEGQRAQVDILGARNTIDMLGVLAEKTRGNLTDGEDRALQTVLFDARMTFLELTSMISIKGVPTPPPGRA